MNELTEKAIFYPKFHSRARVSDHRREAPNFIHWFLKRMGWGTSLGLHTDPAQLQGVVGTTAPPPTSPALGPCLLMVDHVHQSWEGLSAHNGSNDIRAYDDQQQGGERRTRGGRLGLCTDCKLVYKVWTKGEAMTWWCVCWSQLRMGHPKNWVGHVPLHCQVLGRLKQEECLNPGVWGRLRSHSENFSEIYIPFHESVRAHTGLFLFNHIAEINPRKTFFWVTQISKYFINKPFLSFSWCYWPRLSLYSPGCPGIECVDQAGFRLKEPPSSSPQMLGLKAYATTHGQ